MNRTVQAVVAGAVLVVLIGAVALAEINGSATSIVLFAGTVLAAIPGILGLSKAAEAADRTKDVAHDVETVKHQTNGALPAAVHAAITAAINAAPAVRPTDTGPDQAAASTAERRDSPGTST